jgi:two-component system response regulator ChvI
MISGLSHLNGSAICLLDDDPSVLKSTGRLLSSAGWRVQPFEDPYSFLNYAQIHRPRLAVIDIAMPLMNGLEVQKRLRQVSPSTRAFVLTANDDPVIRSTAMKAGAEGFFVKPVEDDEFLSSIEAAIKAGPATQPGDAAAA